MKDASSVSFAHLINLAAGDLGARAIVCSDDYFASMDRLVASGRGEFDPTAYGDRGKIMDGWESRRKRTSGHDWCILALGARGIPRMFDIDTNHFLGNHPPFASVDGLVAAPDAAVDSIKAGEWRPLLGQVPLRPGTQNIFAAQHAAEVTHVRLNIFPDGGVARLRVYGDVVPRWAPPDEPELAQHARNGEVDLVSVLHGGLALACSDSFFGPMNNLLLPGRATDMGGGWETRRRRTPGFDWIVIQLGASGTPTLAEIDTNHFKGNYPDTAAIDGVHAPETTLVELVAAEREWTELMPRQKLEAHNRHFFRDSLRAPGPITHVRLRIHPDGGVSRLRLLGIPEVSR